MLDDTRPTRPLSRLQAVPGRRAPERRNLWLSGLIVLALVYFLAPFRTNVLLLGADDSPDRGSVGRTDTIILATVVPTVPYVGLLSIPRDLWVTVPEVGKQRVNTAYFFAEASSPGSGGASAARTVRENFGVNVHYYAIVHMLGLVEAVDALGGVEVRLNQPTGGLGPGTHHLNGDQALAFVRDRAGGDDFGRMPRAQSLISAMFTKALSPAGLSRLPRFLWSLGAVVETNLPVWQWPRLLFALLRSFLLGVDSRAITREMVVPFTTSDGAQVLRPQWELIQPTLREMY